jgi:hypothetical protein
MQATNRQSAIAHLQYRTVAICLLLFAIPAHAQNQRIRIGKIEFFGTKGVEVEKVKADLTVHEGEELSFAALPELITHVRSSVKESSGEEAYAGVGPLPISNCRLPIDIASVDVVSHLLYRISHQN